MNIIQLTPNEAAFPLLLKSIAQVPEQLYALGNIALLNQPSVAVVGSRNMTNYGQTSCEQLVSGLVPAGLVIVSGLATGIDAIAHRTALDSGGYTIAVLANGLASRYIFPSEHQQLAKRIIDNNGLLISEYPPNTVARRYYFPARNRIIAGISLGTLVIEARLKSGALGTARYALEMNREVFAVPGSVFSTRSAGTHQLIKQGAKLVEQAPDILEELNLATLNSGTLPFALPTTLSSNQQRIIHELEATPLSAEQLADILPFSAEQVAENLTDLEIQGIVRRNMDYTYEISYCRKPN
ncbi:MAG: DNA-processing protein DprA [Patescibacteria group bacterium]|jgi:DNA processing protein